MLSGKEQFLLWYTGTSAGRKVIWILNQLYIPNAIEIWRARSGGKISFVAGNICQLTSVVCCAKYFYF